MRCAATHLALWLWFGLLFAYFGTFPTWRVLLDLVFLVAFVVFAFCPAMTCHSVVGAELSGSGEVLLRVHLKLFCASSLDVIFETFGRLLKVSAGGRGGGYV